MHYNLCVSNTHYKSTCSKEYGLNKLPLLLQYYYTDIKIPLEHRFTAKKVVSWKCKDVNRKVLCQLN